MPQNQPCIRQLPTSVINKIAAGEVIERPASVLKELLENAVDSGATRIEARLEKGGCDRVRVSDNGCGISADQLMLALASHATSKIQDADDLFAVATLGFRGEALASIAEVSHLNMRSRVADDPTGNEVSVRGGQPSDVAPCASAPGTTVDVRNLFFNTPVRRKFMRTVPTELGHATEAFIRIALAYPHVHFLLQHNERVVHDLPAVDRWHERICTLFGSELAEALMWVESEEANVKLSGYVANPTHSRSNNKMQYLFLNGRHIKDRSLQHALGEAYRGLLLTGRFPISFLQFQLPADQIDVNVHPTKLEVRFQDGGRLYSQLLSTLRGEFLSTDLTAHVGTSSPKSQPPLTGPNSATESSTLSAAQSQQQRADVTRWARGEQSSDALRLGDQPLDTSRAAASSAPVAATALPAAPSGRDAGDVAESPDLTSREQPRLRFDLPQVADANALPSVGTQPAEWDVDDFMASGQPSRSAGETDAMSPNVADASPSPPQAMQAHNRYLVTAAEEGLVIIDQHALHERILYEQLREKVLAGAVERQRLLVPEPIDLSPTESAAVLDHQDILSDLGIEIEAFGGSTVLIQAYPAMLGSVDPQELVRQLATQLADGQRLPEKRDVLDELLHMCSCKAAIKAGDPLSAAEITALLEFRHLVQDSHHCPHGRPTTLVFTRQELDRRFKRI